MNDTPKLKWLFKMAWRDSRRNRTRLLLFISSIVLGIAALVAIYSLGESLTTNIDDQAAQLLGADLALSTNKEPSGDALTLIDSIGQNRSEEISFASMVYFTKTGGNRLAQIKALKGEYPYYGSLETIPLQAGHEFRNQRQALVEQSLMLQYQAQVGDSIQVGAVTFAIAGILEKAPGQNGITSTVAPAVYIPMQFLEQTGLMQKGSRIVYRYFYRLDNPQQAENLSSSLKERFELADLDYKTIAIQKEDTGRSFRDLTRFLGLVGFVALLLGCIGVASSIQIYIREKIASIAILRCLGVRPNEAFMIYLIQIIGIGLLGSWLGAVLGTFIQQVLPVVIKDFLPFDLIVAISWSSIIQGILIGTFISILFAMPPLLAIRNISPLNVLRNDLNQLTSWKDSTLWLIYTITLLFVYLFSFYQMQNARTALFFTLGVLLSFGLLYGIALLLMRVLKRFFPSSWGYLPRQGLANLFRPNNQTAILIVAIGLATSLIATLFLTQDILMQRIQLSTSDDQPNIVLFDIQSHQKDGVIEIAQRNKLAVQQIVPIVNMRLEEVNGHGVAYYRADSTTSKSSRIFGREYRVTFRDSLTSSETIMEGKWIGSYHASSGLIPISIEKGFAERGNMSLGDTLTFNVQGTLMQTQIASLRDVNWAEVQTNFLVVFPEGVLEEAPQFHVLMTHVPSPTVSANFQQEILLSYPNISMIDLALVIKILNELFNKIGFVIQFMAGFSILTGVLVLISSVMVSKYQRIQESVLLRTIGASQFQIFSITAMEYFFLGALASLTGIVLSLAGSWALARFSFDAPFNPALWPVAILALLVTLATVLIGVLNSREILTSSPLAILRKET
ncbi:putative ABC transport system permease protein [Dyadobacter jejuensis]|uniref:Putative ABC transport system permease protein n=2 Tax=Dyadobacter jejuensis TaxID=1082580 RepID=A0A316AM68_9BACT|nr:putative ABC transport system permease protein [Dyadobacter jejuensis]